MSRSLEPGRLTRAAIHSEAGEVEVRLSAAGNWQLAVRAAGEREWRLACSGDLGTGAWFPATEREPQKTRYGKLVIDLEQRQAFVGETQLKLAVLQFDLLAKLASAPSHVFTKQELMKAVWGYEDLPLTRTLDTHASRVRVAIRKAGAVGYVVNLHGRGYKLWSR